MMMMMMMMMMHRLLTSSLCSAGDIYDGSINESFCLTVALCNIANIVTNQASSVTSSVLLSDVGYTPGKQPGVATGLSGSGAVDNDDSGRTVQTLRTEHIPIQRIDRRVLLHVTRRGETNEHVGAVTAAISAND